MLFKRIADLRMDKDQTNSRLRTCSSATGRYMRDTKGDPEIPVSMLILLADTMM
jgi:hypothetical protein